MSRCGCVCDGTVDRLGRREMGFDAPGGFEQILERSGIAHAQIAFPVRTKRAAVETGHTGLVQETIRQLLGWYPGSSHIRKRIEGAVGERASKAGNAIECRAECIAATTEFS